MNKTQKGFTLLELLIVIAILAVLATVAVLVINPVEYLKQARDSQRINDLAAVKGAIDLVMAGTSTPFVTSPAIYCTNGTTNPFLTVGIATACTQKIGTGITGAAADWVPVNFSLMAGGSALTKLPTDPTNANGYFYGIYATTSDYVTLAPSFELDAKLESTKYAGEQDMDANTNDGGSQNGYYEIGSKLSY